MAASRKPDSFLSNPEAILGSMAGLFAAEGLARQVAILTFATPEVVHVRTDYGIGNDDYTDWHSVYLHVALVLYRSLDVQEIEALEESLLEKARLFVKPHSHDRLQSVKILPAVIDDPQWRERATSWLRGNVSNQGRIRSDNVAPLSVDGLLFRNGRFVCTAPSVRSWR